MRIEKYRWQQMFLHWISAALILWLLCSGFAIAYLNVAPQTHAFIAFINVALSAVFIPLFLLRWLLHLYWAKPRSLHHDERLKRLAELAHTGLYWVTAIVLLSGVLMMNRDIDVFGWLSIAPLVTDIYWQDLWHVVHRVSCMVLAALVVMHVAAVVMHELCGRRVLRRMLP